MEQQFEDLSEAEIDARIEAIKDKKRRGRPKNQNYLTWEEAREFMRNEMIPSRGKYFEWWDRNKPKTIPRFPYRVYQDEWTSWNDFLNTDNKFNEKVGTKWRPFLEATSWAIKIGLKSQSDWMEYCKQEGALPVDVPARPDLVYDDWRSWSHWLGNRPVEALQSRQEIAAKTQIYYIIRYSSVPENVLTFGVHSDGLTSFKTRWEEEKFTILRMFWYDPEKANRINTIVEKLSSPYMGDDSQRLVPNMWEVVYYLQGEMDQITHRDVNPQ